MNNQTREIFTRVKHDIQSFITLDTSAARTLWDNFVALHPADIAPFIADCDQRVFKILLLRLPSKVRIAVFKELLHSQQATCLAWFNERDRAALLNGLSMHDLADLLEHVSDKDLQSYLRLFNKTKREEILSLLKFHPESAGGIMDTEALTLVEDFTVEKSVRMLQRAQLDRELHRQIYVTNEHHELVGHINIEDLVLQHPEARISSFMRENVLTARVDQDQEEVAANMLHYHVTSVPVVDDKSRLLGVIPSSTLVEVIEQEASEDVYKMAAMTPIKYTYFETSFVRMIYERSSILIVLLMAQTFSSMIIKHHEALLSGFLTYFLTMLMSTGGNTSSQTSAVVIQGMASGEIHEGNMRQFLVREFSMAFVIAAILGVFSFIRVYLTDGWVQGSIAVSLSLSAIVLVSVVLGSIIPIVLKRLKLDPAFSAGPGLATLMDIAGLLIYCTISTLILRP